MTEVQNHGFEFEKWIKSILGAIDPAKYTQKWDIPGKIPISIKFMGSTNALEFGSAVRIWEIEKPFLLIVARWEQSGGEKIVKSIDEIMVTLDHLKKMRGQISLQEVKDLDNQIKKFPPGEIGQVAAIVFAKKWIDERKDRLGLLTITRKIDSKTQRRIQCNINYKNYLKLFGKPSSKTIFRDHEFSRRIQHPSRIFKSSNAKKQKQNPISE